MPKSVKTIIDKMLYKGAMTQKEHDKCLRKLQNIPEIIRCKNCAHYYVGSPYDRCLITDKFAEENDFCSWAEQKDKIDRKNTRRAE